MSTAQTLVLGAVAGLTIFVGLPMGRVRSTSAALRASLGAVATGILVFLFWDVVSHGVSPVETHLEAHDWGAFLGYAALLAFGFTAGMMSLVYYDGWLKNKRATPLVGPGAAAIDEFKGRGRLDAMTQGQQLALLIAIGIGVHNFSEGLAIGVASKSGEIALAGTLIIGFALHNATEGFGIVGPLQGTRPTWRWLILAGVIGGGPTFLGTMVGYRVSSEPLELAFLAVAAGAILFVIGELWAGAVRRAGRNLVLSGIIGGFLLGFATDLILVYAGA
jgi:ZIP family zinc transporter